MNAEKFSPIINQIYSSPVNKGFLAVHEEFVKNGWNLVRNEMNLVVYNNPSQVFDDFTAFIESNNIEVSVPIVSTTYSYTVKFTTYFAASEYMLTHLNNVIKYTADKANLASKRKLEKSPLEQKHF